MEAMATLPGFLVPPLQDSEKEFRRLGLYTNCDEVFEDMSNRRTTEQGRHIKTVLDAASQLRARAVASGDEIFATVAVAMLAQLNAAIGTRYGFDESGELVDFYKSGRHQRRTQ